MKRFIILTVSLIVLLTVQAANKREFRGAWIQCVNGQFNGLSRDDMQRTLSYQLDELQKDGVNTIIFQIRNRYSVHYIHKLLLCIHYKTQNKKNC